MDEPKIAARRLVVAGRDRSEALEWSCLCPPTTNDALANLGVIVAGVLVAFTDSQVPNLVVGAIVAVLVLAGVVRILRL